MNTKHATFNENQSLRISQDLKHYNWLLKKLKTCQDITFRKKVRQSVPVSIPLNRLSRNTALNIRKTMQLNTLDIKNTTMANKTIDSIIQHETSTNFRSPPFMKKTPATLNSIKHKLPVSIVPNRERHNLQNTKATQVNFYTQTPNKLQNMVSVATQTPNIKAICENQMGLIQTENDNIEQEQSKNESSQNNNHAVIDDMCMANIMNKSEEYKKEITNITDTLQNIFIIADVKSKTEDGTLINLEKQKQILKLVECLMTLACSNKEKIAKSPGNLNEYRAAEKNTECIQNTDQLNIRRQISQKSVQHEQTEACLPNKHTNYFQLPITKQNDVNPTNVIFQRDPRTYKFGSQIKEADKQQNAQQFRMYQQMMPKNRTLEQANVRNKIPTQLARFRFSREGWPYPRTTARQSYPRQQEQHPVEQVQIHQSQYVNYNQFTEQQDTEVYYQNQNSNQCQNPRLPVQQHIMYNNIYS